MFIITLRFADKTKAPQFMDGHNAWIKRGFDDGIFLLVGHLQPNAGGAIIAGNSSRADIEGRGARKIGLSPRRRRSRRHS